MAAEAPLPDALERAFQRLGGVILSDETLGAILTLVCTQAKETIPHADEVSVTLRRNGRFETRAHTGDLVKDADELQYEFNEGPCLDASLYGEVFQIDSMSDDDRWPRFGHHAAQMALNSSLSIPLRAEDASVGALNIYAHDMNAFDETDRAVGERFASQAAIVLQNAVAYVAKDELTQQLKEALESREVIGKAIGIVMEKERVSDDEAFTMLKTASQNSNIKLRDIAVQILQELNEKARGRAGAHGEERR